MVFSLIPLNVDQTPEDYKRSAFDNLEFWLRQFHLINKRDNCVIYLLGNKVDDEEHRVMKYEEAKRFADTHKMQYFETSAKTGEGINDVFSNLVKDLLIAFPVSKPNATDNFSIRTKKQNKKKKCC